MTIIEKMARAAFEADPESEWPGLYWDDLVGTTGQRRYTITARAARDALVEGLTDEQVYALSRVNDPFDCEHQWHLRIVRENRAALIEATEVDG